MNTRIVLRSNKKNVINVSVTNAANYAKNQRVCLNVSTKSYVGLVYKIANLSSNLPFVVNDNDK